ncbi:MAG: methionyl-tRNA formyltransferase [Candidatus Sungbacteria bacterium]|nr:methionyl-tRNA formyltransferase [Candidatus Sungbacteria bacterium]
MKFSVNPSILFLGTPEFSIPALDALIAGKYDLVGAVTNPDEPVGRKRILTSPPVKLLAQKHSIPVFQPEKLKRELWDRQIPAADLLVVAAYGKIIPKSILEIPKYGTLNIHPSLLPRWRGASPIQSAILAGDADTGVTIMQVDERMDHGPVVAQQIIPIGNRKVTYSRLHDELAEIGAKLLLETIPGYISGAITPTPQDDAKAIYCAVLAKDDGRIDWNKSAEEIERMVRAFDLWPGAWTTWSVPDSRSYRIHIDEADLIRDHNPAGTPGLVWSNVDPPSSRPVGTSEGLFSLKENKKALLVQTGKGSIEIRRATLEGKKSLTGAELLHGYPRLVGAIFT